MFTLILNVSASERLCQLVAIHMERVAQLHEHTHPHTLSHTLTHPHTLPHSRYEVVEKLFVCVADL